MRYKEYQQVVKKHQPKKAILKNCSLAFLCGGTLGVLTQACYDAGHSIFGLASKEASVFASLCIVTLATLLTFLGVYNRLGQVFGAGLFLPTTGFSNSLTSSAMEGRTEGLIPGIGSSIFSLAGSVIAYGISISIYFCLLYALLSFFGVNVWA